MKKILITMFAVLFVSAVGMAVSNDAWAEGENSGTSAKATANQSYENSGNAKSGGSNIGFSWNGSAFAGRNTVAAKVLSGLSVGGGKSSSAGNYLNQGKATAGSVTSVNTSGGVGGGIGSAIGVAGGAAMNLSSNLAGIVVAKLSNIFLDVKTILYVLAAFGLIGFAFMALFGKVRWGWVCALAFGLAAVSAAGQLIDYVSNGGVSSVTADTLGTNMY